MKNLKIKNNVISGSCHTGKTRKLIEVANEEQEIREVVFVNGEETEGSLRELGLNPKIKVKSPMLTTYKNIDEFYIYLKSSFPGALFCIDNTNLYLDGNVRLDELFKFKDCVFTYQTSVKYNKGE